MKIEKGIVSVKTAAQEMGVSEKEFAKMARAYQLDESKNIQKEYIHSFNDNNMFFLHQRKTK